MRDYRWLGLRHERPEVVRVHIGEANHNHKHGDHQFDDGEHIVDLGRYLRARNQQRGEHGHDEERPPVQAEARDLNGLRNIDTGCGKHRRQINAPVLGQHRSGRDHLQQQVPANDPGQTLAQREVGIGVGAARDRHGGSKLRIAHDGQRAGGGSQHKREDYGWPGKAARRACTHRKNTCAHSYGQPQNHQIKNTQRALELAARLVRIGQRLFNGFGFQPLHAYPRALTRWFGSNMHPRVST